MNYLVGVVLLLIVASCGNCQFDKTKTLRIELGDLQYNFVQDETGADSVEDIAWTESHRQDGTDIIAVSESNLGTDLKKTVDFTVTFKLEQDYSFSHGHSTSFGFTGLDNKRFFKGSEHPPDWISSGGSDYLNYTVSKGVDFLLNPEKVVKTGSKNNYTLTYNVKRVTKRMPFTAAMKIKTEKTVFTVDDIVKLLDDYKFQGKLKSKYLSSGVEYEIGGEITTTFYIDDGEVSLGNGPYGGVFAWRLCLIVLGTVIGIALLVTLSVISYKRFFK